MRGYSIDDEELAAVNALLTRLDDHPLGIRVVAARLKPGPHPRTVQTFLDALAERQGAIFDATKPRGVGDKEDDLFLLFSLSYDALGEREQHAYRWLGVLALDASFTWEDIEALLREGEEAKKIRRVDVELALSNVEGTQRRAQIDLLLDTLVDSSLLTYLTPAADLDVETPTTQSSIFILHSLIHRHARRLLAQDEPERAAALSRHARIYVDVARRVAKERSSYRLIEVDYAQIEAVLNRAWRAWATPELPAAPGNLRYPANEAFAHLNRLTFDCYEYYWDFRGLHAARVEWIPRAIYAARKMNDLRSKRSHESNLGLTYADIGQVEQAIEHYKQALEVFDGSDNYKVKANLGSAYARLAQYHKSIDYYTQAIAEAKQANDELTLAYSLTNLAHSYHALGDLNRTLELYEEASSLHDETKDLRGQSANLGGLGLVYRSLGQMERAIECYQQQLKIAEGIGDRRGEGAALGGLGLVYYSLGEMERAIEYHEQSLIIAGEIGDRHGEGAALGGLGLVYYSLGEMERAIEYHEQSLIIAEKIGDRRGEGAALGGLGLAYAALGQVERAIDCYEQALLISREIGDRRGEGNHLGNLGLAYAALGQVEEAIGYYEQRLIIAREIGDRRGEALGSWNLGLRYEAQGRYTEAAALMQVLVDYEREIGHPDAEAAAARLAEVRRKAGS